jgi:eukaryotic-like serine/threonine-protein kinase
MSKAISSIGSYQILETLGTGANSTILQIRRKADNREYALKIVPINEPSDLKYLEQARHELRIAEMLDHPNLIKIYCLETKKNWFFKVKQASLLIELVRGKTLDEYPPIPIKKLLPIFFQIASALVHMHRRNVFHADLKPNNIILSKQGLVKVIDFGLSWVKGETKERFQGTPEYMAPETIRSRTINDLTDIYNFGATMYRLIGLKPPNNTVSMTETASKSSDKGWASMIKPIQELNASVPKNFAELVHLCLSYNPARRPERMTEVQDSLREIGQSIGIDVEVME